MNPKTILRRFYDPLSNTYDLLLRHGERVAVKALEIAEKLKGYDIDLNMLSEAAVLHDIGVFMTYTPALGCEGKYPYICHGYLGRKLLEEQYLPKHALVCERHVGVGITEEEIRRLNLPLPIRDMVPKSIEEKIICYADKFFSKSGPNASNEKSVEEILNYLEPFGMDKVERFKSWHVQFNE